MSTSSHSKSINLVGSLLLLLTYFFIHLTTSNKSKLFILPHFQLNQCCIYPVYASIIVATCIKNKNVVLLPTIYFQLGVLINVLIIYAVYVSHFTQYFTLSIALYSICVALIWFSISIIYKVQHNQQKTNAFPNKKPKKSRKKNKNKNTHKTSINPFHEDGELQNTMIMNGVMCNAVWHTINICMLCNKHLFNQFLTYDYDVLLSLMWIYWTMEYYSYQFNFSQILTTNNHIILPYLFIIFLLKNYHMFLLLKIFCVIMCLSMIAYKIYQIYDYHKQMSSKNKTNNNRQPIIIYSGQNLDITDDSELKKLVSSLPLNYFFYSSFSSFGVIMAPSIISVFWRVWHLVPLLLLPQNTQSSSTALEFEYAKFSVSQKIVIVGIQFIHSLLILFIVVKQYRLYVLWKYYKIIDISTTLFVFALHTVVSKLPFVVFSVCFFEYYVNGSKSCMTNLNRFNPEMERIKPPMFILTLHYIAFAVNCWVVYYKFLWKNGDAIFKIRLCVHKKYVKHDGNGNGNKTKWFESISLFHGKESLIIFCTGIWLHFCARVFSVFRNNTTIEKFHIVTSMILLVCVAYRHISWQKGLQKYAKDADSKNNKSKFGTKASYFGFSFIFLCLSLLLFKLW